MKLVLPSTAVHSWNWHSLVSVRLHLSWGVGNVDPSKIVKNMIDIVKEKKSRNDCRVSKF